MIDELKELNRNFYELFGELHENAPLMSERQADFMAAKLFETYREEYRRIYLRCEIENKRSEFGTIKRRNALIPKAWRFLFLHHENRAAKVIAKQIERETDDFLDSEAEQPSSSDPVNDQIEGESSEEKTE